jgi:3-dehydroquinate synthase
MKTVHVTASKSYDVIIGTELLSHIGEYSQNLFAAKNAAIISDTNVWPLYGKAVTDSLLDAGLHVCHFVFTAGEASKNGQTYLEILNFLAQNKLSRSDIVIALGGGVVGDIAGFAAATYLRGISFVQLPTTVLSMVDSSVGGKTAIDLPSGKNLAGAFCQPSLVLCDISTLHTLPHEFFRDGCAEIIKYGILYDKELYSHLVSSSLNFDREFVISRCVALKSDVVKNDEFDHGERQKLNLGHTIGHSVETLSNYSITHGSAVAIGMCAVARISVFLGFCSTDTRDSIIQTIASFGLPTQTEYSAEDLLSKALSDKKATATGINFIIPRSVGDCVIHPVSYGALKTFMQAGL